MAIEIVATTKKRSKEPTRVNSLIPNQLRESADGLIDLLKDYYRWMNESGNPSYAIHSLSDQMNVDLADDAFLERIRSEIGNTFPRIPDNIKVWLIKHLVDFYKIRGTEESVKQFFNLLYNDIVEIYYPWDAVLIPSDGDWGATDETYKDNGGFLSDTIVLQDSDFYQKFSYVIRTGRNYSEWEAAFKRLIHPAGFKFFGEIAIIVEYIISKLDGYVASKMPREQLDAIVLLIGSAIFALMHEAINWRETVALDFANRLAFYDSAPISHYDDFTVEYLDSVNNKFIVSSIITISSL